MHSNVLISSVFIRIQVAGRHDDYYCEIQLPASVPTTCLPIPRVLSLSVAHKSATVIIILGMLILPIVTSRPKIVLFIYYGRGSFTFIRSLNKCKSPLSSLGPIQKKQIFEAINFVINFSCDNLMVATALNELSSPSLMTFLAVN